MTAKIFLVLCVVLVEVTSANLDTIGLHWTNNTRVKRHLERWTWGYATVDRADRSTPEVDTPRRTNAALEWDPCLPVERPPTPNYYAANRRVSQVKCYEYMWTMKLIADEVKRQDECANNLLDIIGGRDSKPQEFPHMAAIGWRSPFNQWVFKCGGALISSNFVVTVAHCSKASDRDGSIADVVPQIVRLGNSKIDEADAVVDVRILRILSHPNYAPPKKYFDIALIQLENAVVFTQYVQPACLYTGSDDVLVGQKALLTGWGVVEPGGRQNSAVLQAAEVDILDSRLCDQLFRRACSRLWCGMERSQICAGKLAGGVDACQGDSGGPLQIKTSFPTGRGQIYRLIGVTSFGIGCAQPNLPGIYTRVSSFVDWIENIVWK